MRKISLIVVLIFVAVLVLAMFTAIPEPFERSSESFRYLQAGEFSVKQEKTTFVDGLRTVPDLNVEGQTLPRTLATRIWYAEKTIDQSKRMPLVLYSHGLSGSYDEGEHYAKHFASHGYTFVAVNFPLTNMSMGADIDPVDVINQPADISFILDQLLLRNKDPKDALFERMDEQRIVAMGLSLGGMTTHMLAYDPQRADKRIDVAIAVAAPSAMFSQKFFNTRTLPYLAIASPDDAFIAYRDNALPMLKKTKNATLVTIDGGSHTGYAAQSRWLRWFSNPDSIGCYFVKASVDEATDQDWYPMLGSIEQGYILRSEVSVCESELVPAMNPIRQAELALLASWSFLQCEWREVQGESDGEFCNYLMTKMAQENSAVSVLSNIL